MTGEPKFPKATERPTRAAPRQSSIPEHVRPDRVFIIGGSGSGKSTLAGRLAEQLAAPVYHLDEVARQGGGTGIARSAAEREHDVDEILTHSRWIAEGIHLDWTRPLAEAADIVLWLDHLSWRRSSGNIIRRFVRDAMAEVRRQKGHRKFTRWRDYGRHLSELARAIPEARTYHRAAEQDRTVAVSRAATQEFLAPFTQKLVHCKTEADVDTVLGELAHRTTSRM